MTMIHHADATQFPNDISKLEAYARVLYEAKQLLDGQRNWVCNLANTASLLWHAYQSLPSPSNQVNWAGFYTLDPRNPSRLILAPFHGKPACQSIAFGRGVCGAAAAEKKVVRVEDVREFAGHIACDGDSRSEIVVPILVHGRIVAVIDIDCQVVGGFDEVDEEMLAQTAQLLAESCDWPS